MEMEKIRGGRVRTSIWKNEDRKREEEEERKKEPELS